MCFLYAYHIWVFSSDHLIKLNDSPEYPIYVNAYNCKFSSVFIDRFTLLIVLWVQFFSYFLLLWEELIQITLCVLFIGRLFSSALLVLILVVSIIFVLLCPPMLYLCLSFILNLVFSVFSILYPFTYYMISSCNWMAVIISNACHIIYPSALLTYAILSFYVLSFL